MLWTGIVLGTLMFFSFVGLWFKMPLPIKAASLWSPVLTDSVITIFIIMTATGISSSITGLVASFWCDFLIWTVSYAAHPYAEAWVVKQYAQQQEARRTNKRRPATA